MYGSLKSVIIKVFKEVPTFEIFQYSGEMVNTLFAVAVEGDPNIQKVYKELKENGALDGVIQNGRSYKGVLFVTVKSRFVKNVADLETKLQEVVNAKTKNKFDNEVLEKLDHFLNFNRSNIDKFLSDRNVLIALAGKIDNVTKQDIDTLLAAYEAAKASTLVSEAKSKYKFGFSTILFSFF